MVSTRRLGWLILVGVVANVLTLALAVTINLRLMLASQQRLCAVIAAQRKAYQETPPSTPTGAKLSVAWDNLSRTYHCP